MKKASFARVDERLIHGQVMTAWVKKYWIKKIILVDDGSTKDDTPAICDRYAAQYPNIVRVIHQPNGGHGEGVNQ